MSDGLISRSAAIDIVRNAKYSYPTWPHIVEAKEQMIMAIECAPTVPAEVVVHCKDCEYKAKAKVNQKGFLICPASGMEITDKDHCSYGKRRESEESLELY